MKNIIIYIALFLGFSLTGKAQTIKGGLKAGVNYSLFTQETKNIEGGVGYEIGYFEQLDLENKYKLQVEIEYISNTYTSFKNKYVESYNYLEIPFIIKRSLSSSFDLGIGVKYAKGLRASRITTIGTEKTTTESEIKGGHGFFVDMALSLSKVDLGLRLNFNSGKIVDKYDRRSANFYVAFNIFK